MSRSAHRFHPPGPPKPPAPPKRKAVVMFDRAPGGWMAQGEWDWYLQRVEEARLVLAYDRFGPIVPVWVPAMFEAPFGDSDDARVVRFLEWLYEHEELAGTVEIMLGLCSSSDASAATNRAALLLYARELWEMFDDLDGLQVPPTS